MDGGVLFCFDLAGLQILLAPLPWISWRPGLAGSPI